MPYKTWPIHESTHLSHHAVQTRQSGDQYPTPSRVAVNLVIIDVDLRWDFVFLFHLVQAYPATDSRQIICYQIASGARWPGWPRGLRMDARQGQDLPWRGLVHDSRPSNGGQAQHSEFFFLFANIDLAHHSNDCSPGRFSNSLQIRD